MYTWRQEAGKVCFETGSNIHKADSRFPGGQASGEFPGTQATIVRFPESEDVNLGYALGSFETPSSLVHGSAPHVTSMLLTCS